jgi:regulatory protein
VQEWFGVEDNFKKALNYSFLLLKYRQRTTQELKDRLRRKKFSPTVIQEVIAYLRDSNYLDDKDFALSYTREKLSQGFGERKIVFDLKRLGVPSDCIEFSLWEVRKEIDYKEILKKLISKLYKRYKDKERKKDRIIRYLAQRGFDYDDILRELEGVESI